MTIEEKLEEYNETFGFLEGLDKIEYLVDMAKKSPGLTDDQKTDHNKVYGCASDTWVVVEGSPDAVHVKTDSDAQIVRGMLFLFQQAVDGHSRTDINALHDEAVLEQLGLGGSITNRRMNGFASAIFKIKEELKKL